MQSEVISTAPASNVDPVRFVPGRAPKLPADKATSDSGPKAEEDRAHLLWIDDALNPSDAIVRLLELQGFRIRCAHTGTEGLALARGRVVGVDRLVDTLWPDGPPDDAAQALQNHVSRVRGHLGAAGSRLVRRGPGYLLELTDDGLDVTVSLAYDFVTIGHISATYVSLGFAPPLSLPAETRSLRARVTSLLPQGTGVGRATLEEKRLRVALATPLEAIPPGKVFTVRFDCPAGSRVDRRALSCDTAEVTGASGQPLHENLARDVRCGVDSGAR